jgi:hypothetical protein
MSVGVVDDDAKSILPTGFCVAFRTSYNRTVPSLDDVANNESCTGWNLVRSILPVWPETTNNSLADVSVIAKILVVRSDDAIDKY